MSEMGEARKRMGLLPLLNPGFERGYMEIAVFHESRQPWVRLNFCFKEVRLRQAMDLVLILFPIDECLRHLLFICNC